MSQNTEKPVIIPTDVVDRLVRISSNDLLAAKVFEYFKPVAGLVRYPLGILNLFLTAIGEVTKDEPKEKIRTVRMFMSLCIPKWLEAVIDDKEALAQANADFQAVFSVKD